jgi:hypothetical protein
MKNMMIIRLKILMTFLHIERHKWDMSCFHFDGDPIYDIDDDSRVKSAELFPLEQPSFSENFHDHFQAIYVH